MNLSKSGIFNCFIFPNDVNLISYFNDEDILKISCKKISFLSEIYNIRKNLSDDYGIKNIRSMEILDGNNIFIATQDYDNLSIPEISTNDKQVISAFKTYLFPLAVSTFVSIHKDLEHAKLHNQKDTSKIRQKRKLHDIIQSIVFKDNAKS